MTHYDFWLQSYPGGPYSQEPGPSRYDLTQDAFNDLEDPRARAKVRRMAKGSIRRRQANAAWRRRQRREDRNAQVLF